MKKYIIIIAAILIMTSCFTSCKLTNSNGTDKDKQTTLSVGDEMQTNQPTPADIDYSLERYNLIRRAYWVNGQREKAMTVPCAVEKPLGYCVLLTESGAIIGKFVVDGKVTSLNSYLTPDSEYYEIISGSTYTLYNKWLSDVDGSYGANDNGIFFFTTDGKYIEWTGIYLYSDIPFTVNEPIIKIGE